MVAVLDVRSDTLTLCSSERACPPLTFDLMDVGMSDGPGSGSSLGSKCGEGLTTSSTGAVASPAALDAMHVNFPESWKSREKNYVYVYSVFQTDPSETNYDKHTRLLTTRSDTAARRPCPELKTDSAQLVKNL